MVVLDASVAVMLALREPGSEAADALLLGEMLVAPDLILAEVGNALWRKARLGAVSREDAAEALLEIRRLFTTLTPLDLLHAHALALALRRDHLVYDCFYVALALREGAPLVTADRRLAERFADDAEIRLLAA